MRLIQIPFSHNCIKVRRALELKSLDYTTLDIAPIDRKPVIASSGQGLVPVLEDGDSRIVDSTRILQHLELRYPAVPLLPRDPADHAACWLIEDWADGAFMDMTRRMAYWRILGTPGVLEGLFFPQATGLRRRLMSYRARQILTRRFRLSESRNRQDEIETPRVARIALDRLAGRACFFGDHPTVADVTLAAMVAPLLTVAERVRDDPAVAALLAWARPILGDDVVRLYGGTP